MNSRSRTGRTGGNWSEFGMEPSVWRRAARGRWRRAARGRWRRAVRGRRRRGSGEGSDGTTDRRKGLARRDCGIAWRGGGGAGGGGFAAAGHDRRVRVGGGRAGGGGAGADGRGFGRAGLLRAKGGWARGLAGGGGAVLRGARGDKRERDGGRLGA